MENIQHEYFIWEENSYTEQKKNDKNNNESVHCVTTTTTKNDLTQKDWKDITEPKERQKAYHKTYNKKYREANKDKIKVLDKSYRKNNKEAIHKMLSDGSHPFLIHNRKPEWQDKANDTYSNNYDRSVIVTESWKEWKLSHSEEDLYN